MNLVTFQSRLDNLAQVIADAQAELADLQLAATRFKQPVPGQTVDEYIDQADSATRVYKALEPELGVDRRTILSYVERIVRFYELSTRFPEYGTNLALAKYLASRNPKGQRRIVAALQGMQQEAAR